MHGAAHRKRGWKVTDVHKLTEHRQYAKNSGVSMKRIAESYATTVEVLKGWLMRLTPEQEDLYRKRVDGLAKGATE